LLITQPTFFIHRSQLNSSIQSQCRRHRHGSRIDAGIMGFHYALFRPPHYLPLGHFRHDCHSVPDWYPKRSHQHALFRPGPGRAYPNLDCVFQLSVGQLAWALPAEIGSTRLRQKTVVIGRNAYYIVSVVASVLEPYFVNPTAWNLKGYTTSSGWDWLFSPWSGLLSPTETKGRSYEEINLLSRKASAPSLQRVSGRRV